MRLSNSASSGWISSALLQFAAFLVGASVLLAGHPACAASDAVGGDRRLGLLLPVSPPDYAPYYDRMEGAKTETFAGFTFRTGTIDGVPVVVNVAPATGPLVRSFAAYEMLRRYNVAALLYPGTSGAHLGPQEMRIGDLVLGAGNVDFGNFFMSRSGGLAAHEFAPEHEGPKRYGTFYLDPRLLARLACAAHRTAARTTLPALVNRPEFPRVRPDIFYYGMQGTSEMWLANPAFIDKVVREFGAIDEDGDWNSNLVAVMHGIPFIEVSGISDSILEFPETERGFPPRRGPSDPDGSFVAQHLANEVLLDLIKNDGRYILDGTFTTDAMKPFAGETFDSPKAAGSLLEVGGCAG